MTMNNDKRAPQTLRAILDALMLEPFTGLDKAAKAAGVTRATIYAWQKQSADAEAANDQTSVFYIEWIGIASFWHRHIAMARQISIQGIDARVREMALIGHSEPMFIAQTGQPVWKVSPQIAGDARDLDDTHWLLKYGNRSRDDHFERGPKGELIQERKQISPNPQLLIKACAALLPKVYGESVQHTHSITVGGVLRIGASREPQARVVDADFTAIEDKSEEEPHNVLAVSERAESVEDFERTFGGKRLVEAVLFYDNGRLLEPVPGIVIVEGSPIHEEYKKHGIEVETKRAADLIAEGYVNNFLLRLAPQDAETLAKLEESKHKPPVKPASQTASPDYSRRDDRLPGRDHPEPRAIPTGYASCGTNERLGDYGKPNPGGRSVVR